MAILLPRARKLGKRQRPPSGNSLNLSHPALKDATTAFYFRESGGDTAFGIRNRNAALQNSATFAGGLELDGVNQYANVDSLDFANSRSTVICRAKGGPGDHGMIISHRYNGSTVPLLLSIGDVTSPFLGYAFFTGSWRNSGVSTSFNDGVTRDYAGTYDQVDLKFYVNGQLDSSAAHTTAIPTGNTNEWNIGAYVAGGLYLKGVIEYIIVYDSAKTQEEILEIHEDPYGPLYVPQKWWWIPEAVAAGNTSQLPKGQINVTGQVPSVQTSENKFSNLPKGQINVSAQALSVNSAENRFANIPKGQINVTAQALSVNSAENKFSSVPKGQINVAGQALSIQTSENKFSNAPKGQINISAQALTVDDGAADNTAQLPKGQINVTAQSLSINSAENKFSTLAKGQVNVTGQALTINDGAGEISQLTKGQINISGKVPSISATENRQSVLSKGQININGKTPTISTTEHRQIVLPKGQINIIAKGLTINDGLTEPNTISLTKGQINVIGYAPTISIDPIWTPIARQTTIWTEI